MVSADPPKELVLTYTGVKPLFYPPTEAGGDPTGLSVDLFKIACDKMGIVPKFVRTSSFEWVSKREGSLKCSFNRACTVTHKEC